MALVAPADNVARSMDAWLARSKANSGGGSSSSHARSTPSTPTPAEPPVGSRSIDLEKSEWDGDTFDADSFRSVGHFRDNEPGPSSLHSSSLSAQEPCVWPLDF